MSNWRDGLSRGVARKVEETFSFASEIVSVEYKQDDSLGRRKNHARDRLVVVYKVGNEVRRSDIPALPGWKDLYA